MNLKSAPMTLLLGSAGLVLLTALSWVALIGPAVGAIGDAGDARTEAEDSNAAMSLQLGKVRQQAEDLPETQKLAGRLDAIFPPTADQPGFFGQVKEAATASGIDLDDITTLSLGVPIVEGSAESGAPVEPADPNAEPAEPTVSDLAVQTVSVSAEGSYDELAEFMSRLEKLDRAFLVTSVNFSADGESAPTLTVTGTMYVAPPLGDPPDGKR